MLFRDGLTTGGRLHFQFGIQRDQPAEDLHDVLAGGDITDLDRVEDRVRVVPRDNERLAAADALTRAPRAVIVVRWARRRPVVVIAAAASQRNHEHNAHGENQEGDNPHHEGQHAVRHRHSIPEESVCITPGRPWNDPSLAGPGVGQRVHGNPGRAHWATWMRENAALHGRYTVPSRRAMVSLRGRGPRSTAGRARPAGPCPPAPARPSADRSPMRPSGTRSRRGCSRSR